MDSAIEVTGLGKRYNDMQVLDDISVSIPTGQIVGMLGHNGAGKTTFLKLALGLVRPTAGEMRVLGVPVRADTQREIHRRVGYLPESVAFYGNLTARETITYIAKFKQRPATEGVMLLRDVGLADAVDRRVHTFSKGMRQRLGLAQALLGSPDLLLFDEPTGGLDPVAILQFLHTVHKLRDQGKTIVISSHLLADLEPHLDRAVVLSHGRIVAQGALADMRNAVDLPVIVRAWVTGEYQATLSELPFVARVTSQDGVKGAEIELEAPRSRKLELIRRLVELPSLVDITVKEPSLPEIYARISSDPRPAAGE